MAELENIIVPKYRNFTTGVPSAEFDKVITAIQDQEDKICKVVRDIGNKLRDKITKEKRKSEEKNKEMQSLAVETEKKLNKIIQNNKEMIKACDAMAVIGYKSRNGNFRDGMKESGLSFPNFSPGLVREEQILVMFGKLQLQDSIVSDKEQNVLQFMETPVSLKEIQSPYGDTSELWRLTCKGIGKVWVSGNNKTIIQIDWDGSILKTVKTSENAIGLSLNVKQELVFIKGWHDTKFFKCKNNTVVTLLELSNWRPRGLCHTENGTMLVSLRSLNDKRSRVVRYSGSKEINVIENDNQGKQLFSVHSKSVLHLTENGNGDICVADNAGKAFVVVDSCGDLRFTYSGNIMAQLKNNLFQPSMIVNDKFFQILINDTLNDILHIIDCDGNFICYIECSCTGISVDTDHNLIVGEKTPGKIRIIKYLE